MDIAFIIVIESGDLEFKTRLLVESIRSFTGDMNQSQIWVVQPRKGKLISRSTMRFLSSNNVTFLNSNINITWSDYAYANKAAAAAFVESHVCSPSKTLVFLDSDIVFFRPPHQLCLEDHESAALRPVDILHVGLRSGQPLNKFWEMIYSACGVNFSELWNIETFVDREWIYPLFQAGMVSVKSGKGIFQKWWNNLLKIAEHPSLPFFLPNTQEYTYLELSTLAATILSLCTRDEIRILDNLYNYPLHLHYALHDDCRIQSLNELVAIHYHDAFYDLRWLDDVILKDPYRTWLLGRIPFRRSTWAGRLGDIWSIITEMLGDFRGRIKE